MLTMGIGMEHLPMAATAWALSVFWLGCAAVTQCASAVFILDSPAAAHRELYQGTIDMLRFFPLESPSAAYRTLGKKTYAWCVLVEAMKMIDGCNASITRHADFIDGIPLRLACY